MIYQFLSQKKNLEIDIEAGASLLSRISNSDVRDRGRGVGRGGSEGSDDPPFLGANFIHFLYKVLGRRSVQKIPF